jgi:PPM family protein phosphatase
VLLVVCDGMGGMGRGDEASKLAVEILRGAMGGEQLPADRMQAALRQADDKIREVLCEDVEQPGATAVMAYVLDGAAHIAWVGDSRAYLIRDSSVVHRTRDHKLVEELVEAGQLTAEQARESALAHVVTRALGGRPPSDPPVNVATPGFPWKLHHGDRILLCSDGVSDLIDDDEIADLLHDISPEDATERLVETALLRGGHDNITCIVAVWDGETDDQATPVIPRPRQGEPGRPVPLQTSRRVSDLETDEVAFADQPTAELDRGARDPAGGPHGRGVPAPSDPAGSVWLGVGIALMLLGIVAGLVAMWR